MSCFQGQEDRAVSCRLGIQLGYQGRLVGRLGVPVAIIEDQYGFILHHKDRAGGRRRRGSDRRAAAEHDRRARPGRIDARRPARLLGTLGGNSTASGNTGPTRRRAAARLQHPCSSAETGPRWRMHGRGWRRHRFQVPQSLCECVQLHSDSGSGRAVFLACPSKAVTNFVQFVGDLADSIPPGSAAHGGSLLNVAR